MIINSLAPGGCGCNFKRVIAKHIARSCLWIILVKLFSGECPKTCLMINQHWVSWWLCAVRQGPTTSANVYQDLCRNMSLLDRNDLTGYLHFHVITLILTTVLSLAWELNNWERRSFLLRGVPVHREIIGPVLAQQIGLCYKCNGVSDIESAVISNLQEFHITLFRITLCGIFL